MKNEKVYAVFNAETDELIAITPRRVLVEESICNYSRKDGKYYFITFNQNWTYWIPKSGKKHNVCYEKGEFYYKGDVMLSGRACLLDWKNNEE